MDPTLCGRYGDAHLADDFVFLNLHDVLPCLFERLHELNAGVRDMQLLLVENCLREIDRGNRFEKPSLLSSLCSQFYLSVLERFDRIDELRFLFLLVSALGRETLFCFSLFFGRVLDGLSLGNEQVERVTVRDFDDVAPLPYPADILEHDHFHTPIDSIFR